MASSHSKIIITFQEKKKEVYFCIVLCNIYHQIHSFPFFMNYPSSNYQMFWIVQSASRISKLVII